MSKNIYVSDNDTIKWTADAGDGNNGTNFCLRIVQDCFPTNPLEEDSLAKLACWHSRYILGNEDTSNTSPEDFWQNLVEATVPHADIIKAAMDGKFPGIRIDPKNHDEVDICLGKWSRTVEKQYLANVIISELSIGDCQGLMEPYMEWMPLWLYDHSGITMSCGNREGQYADRWDSMQVGYIYLLKAQVIENFGDLGNGWREKAFDVMKSIVTVYDNFLTGEIFGYELYKEDSAGDPKTPGWILEDTCFGFSGSNLTECGILEAIPNEYGLKKAINEEAYQLDVVREITQLQF